MAMNMIQRPAKRRRHASLDLPGSSFDQVPSVDLSTPPSSDNDYIEDKVSKTQESKRVKRAIPSPPPTFEARLSRATHVLSVESQALAHIHTLYQTSPSARSSLSAAVSTILHAQKRGGKLITCGVGKSAYIAQKLTATCKSLGVRASFMHACEAAHGDLGDIHTNDVLLFVSFSGRTPELLNLLPHLPTATPLLSMSAPICPSDCALLASRPSGILIPTPIPAPEKHSFGVSAPTTSTTVALAVADMLVLTVAAELHGAQGAELATVFTRNHPGGAIGITARAEDKAILKAEKDKEEQDEQLVVLELPSPSISGSDDR
nr:uncharacterized protein CFP56_13289 [Quercus suber]